jgi:hypothetical protein
MTVPGGISDSDPPTGSEFEFNKLLAARIFSEDHCRDFSLATCTSWLRSLDIEIDSWEHSFRAQRKNPQENQEALGKLRENVNSLYQRVYRLCGSRRSYLSITLGKIPEEIQTVYIVFTDTNDEIGDLLNEYDAWANHYRITYKQGKILEAKPARGRGEPEIRKELFDHFKTQAGALGLLAEKVGEASLARPASQDTGAPGDSGLRSA